MEAIKLAISFLVSIFTIIGGIVLCLQTPVIGLQGLILFAMIAVIVLLVKYIITIINSLKTPILIRTDFNTLLSTQAFKGKFNKEYQKLDDLAKCTFTLLLLDQTKSGAWSNTYLYRRIICREGIPFAKGSLTGTPLALFSILSLIDNDDYDFIEYLTSDLAETLNKVIQPDGQYLRRYTVGTVGRVPEMEPARHTSGGLLSAILIGDVTELDKISLKYLLKVNSLQDSWDKGIVIRTLLSVLYSKHFSIYYKLKTYLFRNRLINRLIDESKFAKHQSLIWSHPYEYGKDINNQWATIWALYPLMSDKLLSKRKRNKIKLILESLINSQISASENKDALLPSEIDGNNYKGKGEFVFSTVLIPTIFRSFDREDYLQQSLTRILNNSENIIIRPSQPSNDDVKSIEGYFAWSAMCLTAASFGVTIDKTSTKLIMKLIKELKGIQFNLNEQKDISTAISNCLLRYNIFPNEFIEPLKISIINLLKYRNKIDEEELILN
jgi:hypothetical protein